MIAREASPVDVTLCSTCGRILNATGDCLACLLRVGFDQPLAELASPVFGDFEIARREDGSFWELGRGAMGVTYRANDNVLNRSVALKVIDVPEAAGDGQIVRDRFLREARAAAAFRHPNVAGVFHFGASPGGDGCYYAMELVEGETLEALVRRDGPLKVEAALEIALQVARALMAAAGQGLVHRDLKPGNIMLTRSDATTTGLEVKVIDFGLAKAIADGGNEMDLTKGGFVGTPAFASPEQFSGAPADARSDIYSLGVTLWYALTGEVPYAGKTIEEIRHGQTEVALPSEQLIARKIPTPVMQLLSRTLALNPLHRPGSARELMEALESCRAQLFGSSPNGRFARHIGLKVAALVVVPAIAAATFFALRLQQHKAPVPPPVPAKSIAVLPFENLSADKENAYFADGIHDDILAALSRIDGLKVISRTSVVSYRAGESRNLRAIAQELGVAHVLEGSVRRAAGKVRVTTQLIEARSDSHLWGESYDRDLADVFAIQSDIALQVAAQLQTRLLPKVKAAIEQRPTEDLAAYDLYLRGKSVWNHLRTADTDLLETIRLLDQAVGRDPTFSLAYCLSVHANASLYAFYDHTVARRGLAERALEAATRLQPAAGETHLARAEFLFRCDSEYDQARAELALAQEALPGAARIFNTMAKIDKFQGRWTDSIRNYEKSVQLDPRNSAYFGGLCASYLYVRRYSESAAALQRSLAVDPNNVQAQVRRAQLDLHWRADTKPLRALSEVLARDDPAAAVAWCDWIELGLCERDAQALERGVAALGDNTTYECVVLPPAWFAGLAARFRGDEIAARSAFMTARAAVEKDIAEQPDYGPPLCALGLIDAVLGRKEEAMQEGRRAVELLPVTKDALKGQVVMEFLAMIYALSGEKELAIEQLALALRSPISYTFCTYGYLRLYPLWDSLRGDPRFEKLVASLAPKPGE